jgi:hypothetical protein
MKPVPGVKGRINENQFGIKEQNVGEGLKNRYIRFVEKSSG